MDDLDDINEAVTPPVDAIRWDLGAQGLFELCERHWSLLEPELRRLQYESDHGRPMTDEERRETSVRTMREMQG